MPDAIPEQLVTYLAARDALRAKAVDDFLAKLTPRERHLVHDLAVMGYVQGLQLDRDDAIPTDTQITALVVDACLAFPDKYPAVNTIAAANAGLDTVWQIETKQRGEWRQWVPDRDNHEEARAEYNDVVTRHGDRWAYRLVRADTTRTIEAQHLLKQDGEPE